MVCLAAHYWKHLAVLDPSARWADTPVAATSAFDPALWSGQPRQVLSAGRGVTPFTLVADVHGLRGS